MSRDVGGSEVLACALWLLRIAAQEDRTVNLRHIMDFGFVPFCHPYPEHRPDRPHHARAGAGGRIAGVISLA